MRIVVDARMLRSTGIGRYVTEIVTRLPRLDPESEFIALLRRADMAWEPPSPNVRAVEADWGVYSAQAQLRLPVLLRRLRPDIVHFPHFPVPLLDRTPRVVTVQDLTMVDHRVVRDSVAHRLVYPVKHAAMVRTLRAAVTGSAAVLTATHFVRDELRRRFPGVDGARITVTPYGGPSFFERFAPVTVANRSKNGYLLCVGNFYPYKNVRVVVDALGRLAATHPTLRLVLVGSRDEFAERVRRHAVSAGLADRVELRGYVDDAELARLYAGASVFVFPSLSEGFGFPGLEAMAHDVPVVAARASCLPETYGDAASWFDPRDADDLARVITKTLDDPAERARLVAAGHRRTAGLSWDRTARGTLAVYRRVAATATGARAAAVATAPLS